MKPGLAITLGLIAIVVIVLSSIVLIRKKSTTSTTSQPKEQYVAPAQAPVPVLPSSFIQSFPSSIPQPHETYAPINAAQMKRMKKQPSTTAQPTTAQLITGSKQNPNQFTAIQDPYQMNLATPKNFNSVPQLQALASGMSPLAMINKYKKFSASNIDPAKNFL